MIPVIITIYKQLLVISAVVKLTLMDLHVNLVRQAAYHVWVLILIAKLVTLSTIIIFLDLHVFYVLMELILQEKPVWVVIQGA